MSNNAETKQGSGKPENLVSLADNSNKLQPLDDTRHTIKFKTAPQSRSAIKRAVIRTSNSQVSAQATPSQVTFDRRELNEILRIYGFKVASGEWRDYSIDHLKDRAIFSVFRKSSEIALYRIEKNPKLARKQGEYSVISVAGAVLKRGSELRQVLRVFDKKPKLKVL